MQGNGTEARAARAFIATAAAVGVALVLQIEWLESAQTAFVWFTGFAVALGLGAWVYAAPVLHVAAEAEAGEEIPARRAPRPLLVLLAAAIGALLAALLLLWVDLRSSLGGWLWLAGWLGVLVAVALIEYGPRLPAVAPEGWKRIAAASALVLFALLLRTVQLERIPADLVDDESLIALWGMNALHGTPEWDSSRAETTTIFRKGGAAEPLSGCVVHAAVMQVAGETIFGLRFTAALAGAIGVGLLYLVLREFLRPGPSLAAAFLLAVCHTHLYWTRSGMTQALVTMAGTAVILFTLRGLRSRRFFPWLVAGAFLGLAQHFYEGGRFLVPILAPFFLLLAVLDRTFLRRHTLHVAAMALMSIAIFAPLGFWYLSHPEELLAITHGAFIFEQPDYLESRYPGLSTAQVVLAQLRRSLEGFTVQGNLGTFYPIWVPLLDPVVRALVMTGIAGFTLTLRPAYVLVSLWLWVPILIACTVTVDPPPMSRLMLALPAFFAIAGAVFQRLGRLARLAFGGGGAAVARLLALLLLAGSAAWNIDIFFLRYPSVFPRNSLTAEAEVAAAAGDAYKAYFVGENRYADAPTVRFLARDVAREDIEPEQIPVQERGRRGALFLVSPDTGEALERLRAAYPGGESAEHRDAKGGLLFTSYRVERDGFQRRLGAEAPWKDPDLRFGSAGEGEGEFSEPRGLALDAQGRVYVADGGNRRIDVFADGALIRSFGAPGGGKASVGDVWALAVESDGSVLALDRGKHWIKRFSPSGERLDRLGGAHVFDDPVAVAAAPDGSVLVLDAAKSSLVRLSHEGEVVARTGQSGHGPGHFYDPVGLAVGGDGRVYVADLGNRRLQRFSQALAYEMEWRIPRAEQPPAQMLAAAGDAVYVIDGEGRRVLEFSRDGEPRGTIGGEGPPPNGLAWLAAVAADARGNVYVLDAERASVYRFATGEADGKRQTADGGS